MSGLIDYAIDHARLTIATLIFLLCAGLALAFLARRGEQRLELGAVPRTLAFAAAAWVALCVASLASR